jgi:hypothetical protein
MTCADIAEAEKLERETLDISRRVLGPPSIVNAALITLRLHALWVRERSSWTPVPCGHLFFADPSKGHIYGMTVFRPSGWEMTSSRGGLGYAVRRLQRGGTVCQGGTHLHHQAVIARNSALLSVCDRTWLGLRLHEA